MTELILEPSRLGESNGFARSVNYSDGAFNFSYPSYNISYSDNNVTLPPSDDARDESIAVIEVAVSATILFLAVAGNGCVLASLYMRKRRRLSRMQLMILHLSLADLFVAFFNVLPQLAWDVTFRFQGGEFLCKSVKYLQVVAMYASAYVLLATATDRYLAICHPFLSQSWTPQQAHLMVILAWVASLLLSVPQIFIFSLTEVREGVYDCWAHFDPEWTLPTWVTWNTVSIFVVPTCVLVVLYGRISWVVWKAGRLEANLMVKKGKVISTEKMESQSSSCTTTSHSAIVVNNCCSNKNNITSTIITTTTTVTNTAPTTGCTGTFFFNNSLNDVNSKEKAVTSRNCNDNDGDDDEEDDDDDNNENKGRKKMKLTTKQPKLVSMEENGCLHDGQGLGGHSDGEQVTSLNELKCGWRDVDGGDSCGFDSGLNTAQLTSSSCEDVSNSFFGDGVHYSVKKSVSFPGNDQDASNQGVLCPLISPNKPTSYPPEHHLQPHDDEDLSLSKNQTSTLFMDDTAKSDAPPLCSGEKLDSGSGNSGRQCPCNGLKGNGDCKRIESARPCHTDGQDEIYSNTSSSREGILVDSVLDCNVLENTTKDNDVDEKCDFSTLKDISIHNLSRSRSDSLDNSLQMLRVTDKGNGRIQKVTNLACDSKQIKSRGLGDDLTPSGREAKDALCESWSKCNLVYQVEDADDMDEDGGDYKTLDENGGDISGDHGGCVGFSNSYFYEGVSSQQIENLNTNSNKTKASPSGHAILDDTINVYPDTNKELRLKKKKKTNNNHNWIFPFKGKNFKWIYFKVLGREFSEGRTDKMINDLDDLRCYHHPHHHHHHHNPDPAESNSVLIGRGMLNDKDRQIQCRASMCGNAPGNTSCSGGGGRQAYDENIHQNHRYCYRKHNNTTGKHAQNIGGRTTGSNERTSPYSTMTTMTDEKSVNIRTSSKRNCFFHGVRDEASSGRQQLQHSIHTRHNDSKQSQQQLEKLQQQQHQLKTQQQQHQQLPQQQAKRSGKRQKANNSALSKSNTSIPCYNIASTTDENYDHHHVLRHSSYPPPPPPYLHSSLSHKYHHQRTEPHNLHQQHQSQKQQQQPNESLTHHQTYPSYETYNTPTSSPSPQSNSKSLFQYFKSKQHYWRKQQRQHELKRHQTNQADYTALSTSSKSHTHISPHSLYHKTNKSPIPLQNANNKPAPPTTYSCSHPPPPPPTYSSLTQSSSESNKFSPVNTLAKTTTHLKDNTFEPLNDRLKGETATAITTTIPPVSSDTRAAKESNTIESVRTGSNRTTGTRAARPSRCFSPCISRAKLKTIKLTLTVIICYVICWLPFFLAQMWAAFDANAPFQGQSFTIIMLLASVNSCTNPWIYTVFSNTICSHARKWLSTAAPSQLVATTQNATEALASKFKNKT